MTINATQTSKHSNPLPLHLNDGHMSIKAYGESTTQKPANACCSRQYKASLCEEKTSEKVTIHDDDFCLKPLTR